MKPDLQLLQFTDPHLYGDASQTLRGIATLPALTRTLAHARADIHGARAILVTGDIVQDDPAGYPHFRGAFGGLGKPVYCIPGNHDDVEAMSAALAEAPFQICGHADFERWRVVMLDSSVPGMAQGRLSLLTLQRLEAALASADGRYVLVCLHHHPVTMDSRWLDTVALTNADEFFAVIDRYECVRALLWGHVHQAFEGERKGVRLMGTPSTCAQFRPHAANFAIDSQPPAYRRLNLHADGSVESEVVWVSEAGAQSRTATSQNSLRA
ncbi:MAG: 3',5'-cyclic-AMP phosphodiesterase [Steroidobacteraceae bacterium]